MSGKQDKNYSKRFLEGTNMNVHSFTYVIFYAPEIEDRGAYCFGPVCHSVILSSSLKL